MCQNSMNSVQSKFPDNSSVGFAVPSTPESEPIMSMATYRKSKSGLPVNVWLDDGMAYRKSKYGKRIKFQPDRGDRPVTDDFTTMTISDDPKVIGEHELSNKEIQQLKDFVTRNRDLLELMSDMEIDFEDFLKLVR